MFIRAFRVFGLIVRVAEAKASRLAFAARRSAMLMLGYVIAVVMALFGVAILLGSGYVALEPIVGVPVAMLVVGVVLVCAASLVWVIAGLRTKGSDQVTTEQDARTRVENVEQLLRSTLGLTDRNHESELASTSGRQSSRSRSHSEPLKGVNDPKVLLAAGVAIIGLLGPRLVFKSIRIAAALGSASTVAKKLMAEGKGQQDAE